MTIIQILLLIAGAVIFALGFFIPEGNGHRQGTEGEQKEFSGKLKEMADRELKDATRRVRDMIDEEVSVARDSSERSLEKITNEKIMAINEYGKTVTDEIEKNHKEVVFMYDMLNDKTTDIKNTIRKYEAIEKKTPKAAPNNAAAAPKSSPKPKESSEAIHIPKLFATTPTEAAAGEKTPTPGDKAANTAAAGSGSEIIRLHRENVSDVDIAKRLGIGVGEVRLAISLGDAGGQDES